MLMKKKTKTLDGILSAFTKVMDELKAYGEEHAALSQGKVELIQKLTNEVKGHEEEVLASLQVHTNLQTLLKRKDSVTQ